MKRTYKYAAMIHPVEPKQQAHSPLLAAGLASKLKTDYIPCGRRFPDRSAAGNLQSALPSRAARIQQGGDEAQHSRMTFYEAVTNHVFRHMCNIAFSITSFGVRPDDFNSISASLRHSKIEISSSLLKLSDFLNNCQTG